MILKNKFKDKYPAVTHVFNMDQGKALTIDRSSKKDLISEYIQRIKGVNKLKNEVKWIKDEIQRRKSASSSASASASASEQK